MRAEALNYAKVFPNLEFIHVGKISFKISHVGNSPEVEVIEVEERFIEDGVYSWRCGMFGMSR